MAEEEFKKSPSENKGYIAHSANALITLLLECIQAINIEENDDDDDELGVALSSGCCLASISLLLRNDILEPILTFVSNNMANPNWKLRYAALLSLGAIVEGPEKVKFMQIIQSAIQPLIGMFNDPNQKVKEAIAWVFSKIIEHHSEVIINPQVMEQLMPQFIQGL